MTSFFAERVVVDRVVDPRDVHQRDAPRAEVEVADLAVSHLPFGEADVGAARPNEPVGIPGLEGGEGGHLREPYRVGLGLGPFTEAVEDHEHHGAGTLGHGPRGYHRLRGAPASDRVAPHPCPGSVHSFVVSKSSRA